MTQENHNARLGSNAIEARGIAQRRRIEKLELGRTPNQDRRPHFAAANHGAAAGAPGRPGLGAVTLRSDNLARNRVKAPEGFARIHGTYREHMTSVYLLRFMNKIGHSERVAAKRRRLW